MEDFSFIENGITYHVIATYYDKEYTKKNYMLYTDNNFKDGQLQVFYSIYEEYPDKKIKLLELKTPEEKKVGLAFLKAILEDTKGQNVQVKVRHSFLLHKKEIQTYNLAKFDMVSIILLSQEKKSENI